MKAIIIGATSGIGRELAIQMTAKGYELGITGRRAELLETLNAELGGKAHLKVMDITSFEEARQQLFDLIAAMGGVDIVVINSGVGDMSLRWDIEQNIINTNATGFAAMANAAFYYFSKNGGGQIVGISSVAAERAGGLSPSYHATKVFASRYMDGLRLHAKRKKLPITITDIRPGFVKTPMTDRNDPKQMVWMASVEKATAQILTAIENKQRLAYITRRWAIAAWIMRNMPEWLYARLA